MAGCLPIDEADIPKVLAALSGRYRLRDRALMVTGIRTGFRISELLSLTIAHVIRGGRYLERIEVKRRYMKGGRNADMRVESRSVPMHPEIPEALGPWLKQLRAMGFMQRGDYLFQGRARGNRPISRWQALRMLKRACAAVGLVEGIGTHSLRKTFAARMNRAFDGNIYLIAEALGEKDVNAAKAYMSFDRRRIDAAILSAR